MQLVFRIVKFDVKGIHHETFADTIRFFEAMASPANSHRLKKRPATPAQRAAPTDSCRQTRKKKRLLGGFLREEAVPKAFFVRKGGQPRRVAAASAAMPTGTRCWSWQRLYFRLHPDMAAWGGPVPAAATGGGSKHSHADGNAVLELARLYFRLHPDMAAGAGPCPQPRRVVAANTAMPMGTRCWNQHGCATGLHSIWPRARARRANL